MLAGLQDCISQSELTEEEIEAIAEHEHLPEMAALEYGNYLLHRPDGPPAIKKIIFEDIEAAKRRGDRDHALALKLVLRRFVEEHPEAQ